MKTILPFLFCCLTAFGQTATQLLVDRADLAILSPTNSTAFFTSNRVANLAGLALSNSINSGVPNGSGATVNWSQLLGVPAGFADNSDDGAGAGGSGTVTSVGLLLPSIFSVSGSPVTNSGTLTGSLITQTTNTVFAGPASGAAANPAFRVLVDADIPAAIARDSEISAAYQPLDADLTSLAAGTAMATAITNAASVGAPTLIAGSTNVASALAGKAPVASPVLTGDPTGPTPSLDDDDTSLATTAFVQSELKLNVLPSVPTGATNHVCDFNYAVVTYTVTNNVWILQSTNRPASSTNAAFTIMRFAGDSVDRALGWNASWKRLGTNITTIPANKVVVLSAMVVGNAETGVTIGLAKEE